MHVLIADPDERFCRVLSDFLRTEGYEVGVSSEGRKLLDLARQTPPDVLVIDAHLPGTDVPDLLRALQDGSSVPSGCPALVALPAEDEDGKGRFAGVAVAGFLRKPFSARKLSRALASLDHGSESEAEDSPEDPLRRMVSLWSERSDGVVYGKVGEESRFMMFGGGAPLDPVDLEFLRRLVCSGGTFRFDPCEVDETGRAADMASLLWSCAGDMASGPPILFQLDDCLLRTPLCRGVRDLPLSSETRRLLSALEEGLALGELLQALDLAPQQVGTDIEALQALGMVRFEREGTHHMVRSSKAARPPASRRRQMREALQRSAEPASDPEPPSGAPRRRASPPRAESASSSSVEVSGVGRPDQGKASWFVRSTPPSDPGSSDSVDWDLFDDLDADAGDSIPWAESEPGPVEAPSEEPSDESKKRPAARSIRKKRRRRARNGAPNLRSKRSRRCGRRPTLEEVALLKRLKREVALARDTDDPWVILGLPRDASAEMVHRVGERMLQQYETLEQHRASRIRKLAQRMRERVCFAIREIRPQRFSLRLGGKDDAVFRRALDLVEESSWEQADRFLRALHKKHMDQPVILAFLGWARFHNPSLPRNKRREEARENLALAIQFQPDFAEAHYFMAHILADMKEKDRALRHARLAVKQDNRHPEARRLLHRLQS